MPNYELELYENGQFTKPKMCRDMQKYSNEFQIVEI